MNAAKIKELARQLSVLAGLTTASCAYFPFQQPGPSPLLGTWSSPERNQVIFSADAVVIKPDKGPAATLSAAECNGKYKLLYGRMDSAALQRSFPSQPDLQSKLKQMLVQPEYPVADVTCDQGGTTYLMLDDGRMLAVYRDAGVGGLETLSRL